VVSGKQRRTLGEHGYWVSSVAFSPDGTKLATASVDKTARLWDLESGKSAGGPFVHNEAVNFVAFSMDGTKLATASLDKTACLWDLGSGKRLGRPLEHQGEVYAVSFSPDGTMLATASADKSARLWDVATGKPLGPPLEHKECVNSAVFSPDGKTLATGSTNVSERWISTAVQLWRIDSTPTESAEHWVVWASTLTGLVAEPGGTTRVLTPTELADCHARLRRLGGTPKSFLEAVARRR
jgi:WD40 repeat protein